MDNIVPEPLGGAHRNTDEMAKNLKQCLLDDPAEWDELENTEGLVDRRYQRLMSYGYVSL
ncbi:hypothetical protein [Neisseria montereyensis]|uniref:hypothetical protein n=1 Tax=Neisseria montereyensis TaxID=2973938 RepID=UPI003EC04ECE